MNNEWTLEEMREALFGDAEISAPVTTAPVEEIQSDVGLAPIKPDTCTPLN